MLSVSGFVCVYVRSVCVCARAPKWRQKSTHTDRHRHIRVQAKLIRTKCFILYVAVNQAVVQYGSSEVFEGTVSANICRQSITNTPYAQYNSLYTYLFVNIYLCVTDVPVISFGWQLMCGMFT